MAIDPSQRFPGAERPQNGNGSTRWLLGALGLLWVGRLAVRAWRKKKIPLAERERLYDAPPRFSRLGVPTSRQLQRLPKPIRGHETRDANAKWIFGLVVFLLVFGLGIHGILAWFLSALNHTPSPKDHWEPIEGTVQAAAALPPLPRLQVSPPVDLQSFRAREEKELHSYGWVNRTSGIVHIPIERAMELVLQEGLPTRPGGKSNQAGPSSYQLIQKRLEHRQPEIVGERGDANP